MNQVVGQSVNQTLNFGVNFSNANASNQMDMKEIAIAYSMAVSSSIVGSVGLRKLLLRIKLPGLLGKALLESTPYLGLVTASSVNLFFSRSKDLT